MASRTSRAARKDVVKKIGDEVKVGKDHEWVQTPDGSVASVRSGGSYRFAVEGKHVIGKAKSGGGITGTTYFVKK